MTFRQSMSFVYDGIASEDMGVVIASPDGGLFQEAFLPSRSIIEKKIPKRNKAYFQGVDSDPLSFSFHIFLEEWAVRDNLRQIQRWLFQPYYKPLIFGSQTEKMYYAILEGDSELTHNGGKEGYVHITMRCDSSYSYSQFIFNESSGEGTIFLNNDGDIPIKPKVRIQSGTIGGAISIKNLRNNTTCVFENIKPEEELLIDFEQESIESSLEYLGIYRYDDHNDGWIQLDVDDNELEIVGDVTVHFEYQTQFLS